MVTEFNKGFPDEPGSTLSGIFSTMTTLNTVVAIGAGIVAESATDLIGTQKAPFMVAVVVLMASFVAVRRFWVGQSKASIPCEADYFQGENYGERIAENSPILDSEKLLAMKPPRNSMRVLLRGNSPEHIDFYPRLTHGQTSNYVS